MEQIKSIKIERVEGKIEDLMKVDVKSFAAANKIIEMMATTAPHNEFGYDKTDFVVEWADGESYKGRLDLQNDMSNGFDLVDRIKGGIKMMVEFGTVKEDVGNNFINKYLG